jgi:hypothetical protein
MGLKVESGDMATPGVNGTHIETEKDLLMNSTDYNDIGVCKRQIMTGFTEHMSEQNSKIYLKKKKLNRHR